MAEVLRTDDVTQADRFAQWRHWISATFVPLWQLAHGHHG